MSVCFSPLHIVQRLECNAEFGVCEAYVSGVIVTHQVFVCRCCSLEQQLEEVKAKQPASSSVLAPLQAEQHAAQLHSLQQRVRKLQEESDAYR